MIKTKLFRNAFVLLVIVATLHIVSVKFYLYEFIWWIDVPIHFIAGVCVGVTGILFYSYLTKGVNTNKSKAIIISVTFALIVGIFWEMFELYFDITAFSDGIHYVTDTSSDMIMDITGGFLGSLYSLKYLKNNNEQ
jgi:hypothetical protein